jgi:predicted amidohydrolase YtcJ
MLAYARANGLQVAVHAIGDACLDRVLCALERARATYPGGDFRDGIVHCQITRPDQLERIAAMDLHVYAQSIFLDYDTRIVRSRVGEKLASTSYAWKTLIKKGVTVSNGTDCPVELPFALGGIQCAVTRTDLAGRGVPYLPEEAFTVQEALDSYTAAGAYASFEEGEKGKIVPGMLADFVILGANPFCVEPDTIGAIPVCATYVGGKVVHQNLMRNSSLKF